MGFKTVTGAPRHAPRWYHCTACRYQWEALGIQPCGKCASSDVYDLTHIPQSTFDENRFVGYVEYVFNQGASMVANHGAIGAEVVGMQGMGAAVVKAKSGAPREAYLFGMPIAVDDWGRIVPHATSPAGTKVVGHFHRYIEGTIKPGLGRQPIPEALAKAKALREQAERNAQAELEAVRKRQREDAKMKAKLFVNEELDEIIAKLEGRDG